MPTPFSAASTKAITEPAAGINSSAVAWITCFVRILRNMQGRLLGLTHTQLLEPPGQKQVPASRASNFPAARAGERPCRDQHCSARSDAVVDDDVLSYQSNQFCSVRHGRSTS